jgi:hypothetical protein
MDLSEFHFSIAHMSKIAKWLVWTIEIIFYIIAGSTAQLTSEVEITFCTSKIHSVVYSISHSRNSLL